MQDSWTAGGNLIGGMTAGQLGVVHRIRDIVGVQLAVLEHYACQLVNAEYTLDYRHSSWAAGTARALCRTLGLLGVPE